MEILITISNFLILGLIIITPVIILKRLKTKRTLIIYSLISLFVLGVLMLIFAWWSYESDLVLLKYYGYSIDGMSDTEFYRNVSPENMKRVKSLETSIMGIGWPMKAIFGYVIFIPYLIFVYIGKIKINRMKKKNSILFISIMIFGLLISCNDDKEDECISSKTEYVTSVNSPTTGMVNEKIAIEVNFQVFNGCGGFGKFIETKNGNSHIIEVEAQYVGCICTQDTPIRTVNYEFTASNTGDYELNFKSSPTEFITINLTIN